MDTVYSAHLPWQLLNVSILFAQKLELELVASLVDLV
jgi:hypothetical protein